MNPSDIFFKSVCYVVLVGSYVWLARRSILKNFLKFRNCSLKQAVFQLPSIETYEPVHHHWFFATVLENEVIWEPFSLFDSKALEDALKSATSETLVATNGGRYDVNLLHRERIAVYWSEPPTEVRRCSWFFNRNTFGRFVPYEETLAMVLESEYQKSFESSTWYCLISIPNGDCISFHGPDKLILYPQAWSPHSNNLPLAQSQTYTLKRGVDDFDIDGGESTNIDHLLFIVHGVGSACDLRFRSIISVVEEFRSMVQDCIHSHYHYASEAGIIHRIEVLPISWHGSLHSEDTGIDQCLKNITLDSIPRIREFTNDTLLDILFYTSPIYCQTIITTVGTKMNDMYNLFKERNPSFYGGVSVAGHSLGSLILFDLLCHQPSKPKTEQNDNTEDNDERSEAKTVRKRMSIIMSKARTQQPELHYPDLHFQPSVFFALGSPIGMFITIRGVNILGEDFALPTCNRFLNIFHPNDPVAYRIESLINPDLGKLQPVVIPHYKGRKRIHLEITDKLCKMTGNLRSTFFNRYKKKLPVNTVSEDESDQELSFAYTNEEQKGVLNSGRRIDYVLQEGPLEFLNEYIFAVTSHFCYWKSQDTMLMIAREIYSSDGIIHHEAESVETMKFRRTMEIKEPCSSQAGCFYLSTSSLQ